jgi:hypothetical protein
MLRLAPLCSWLFAYLYLVIGAFAGVGECAAPIWENPPVETVPEPSEEWMRWLSDQKPVEAEIRSGSAGHPELLVDGVAVPALIGNLSMAPRSKLQIGEWKEAGVKILAVYFDVGVFNQRLGYSSPRLYQDKPFWDGKERYNREQVDEVLARVVKVYPEACIILCLRMDTYPEWVKENPAEVMLNAAGQAFVGSTHFQRVGTPKGQREKELWSFHSPVLQDDFSRTLTELVKTVEHSPWGKRVVGYWLGGGYDGQLYFWQAPTSARSARPELWGDFSAPARRAWTSWLEARYLTVDALNRAWGANFSEWGQALPPSAELLAGAEPFAHAPKDGAEIDWRRFSAEARNGVISRLAQAVRSASGRKIIIGAPSGDSGARSDLTANAALMRNANLDFFTHQAGYNNRLPPALGGVNALLASYAANGKLFIADLDHRTWLSKPVNEALGSGMSTVTDAFVGRAADLDQLRAMWRRELGRLWANGATAWLNPLANSWAFLDPGIRQELRILSGNERSDASPALHPEVALIYDETSIDFLRREFALHGKWAVDQRRQLDSSGVAWSAYYLDDLIEGKVQGYKVYIFQNLLRLEPRTQAAIRKLQANGNTLVFLQGVGYGSPGLGSDALADIVGLHLSTLGAAAAPTDAAGEGAAAASLVTATSPFYEMPGFSLFVDDPAAMPGGRYLKSSQIAVGQRSHADWTSVFVGATVLNAEDANRLAKDAGAWVATGPGVCVAAGRSMLMLHPLSSQTTTIQLPFGAVLTELDPGSEPKAVGTSFELKLEAGKTYLFRVSPAEAKN